MKAVFISACLAWLLASAALGQKPELVVETGHTSGANSLAFSPDGHTLASGGNDNTIKLWDVDSGRELRTFVGHTGVVNSVAFSPDGRTLASGSDDKTTKLWDVPSGRALRTLAGHTGQIASVVFSPDGRTLASGSWDNTIKLWGVADGSELRTLTGHTSMVETVAFSPDGSTLASGGEDQTVKLWDVTSGREIRTMTGQKESVVSVAFSPNGQTLASGSQYGTIKLWDVTSGQELHTLAGHTFAVFYVAFSPDGRTLESGSSDKTIRLWDVSGGRELRTIASYPDGFFPVVFSPDGRFVALGVSNSSIKLLDVASGHELRTIVGHTSRVNSVAFSPDGRTLASGGGDHTIRIWDAASGGDQRTLTGHTDNVTSVAISADGRMLASGSEDATIKLWDLTSGRELRTLSGHWAQLFSVAFSPDGHTLASGSWDETIKLWDVASGRELRTLTGHQGWVFSVAFSPDGRTLASGSQDETIKLWDVASGRELRTLAGQASWIFSVAFSPDGHTLASGNFDNTIKLWDVASGGELRTFAGHTGGVNSVAFSPDGRTLASGSWDTTIKLWDVTSGHELRTLAGHSDIVQSVVFRPDGQSVLSGSDDGSVRAWDATSGDPLTALYALDQQDWAVVDPWGRFDASPGGMALMHYVVAKQCGSGAASLEPIDLAQLKNRYYEPGLLAKVFGFDRQPLRSVSAFDHVDLYPEVQPVIDGNSAGKLSMNLTNCGGGIGQVQVFVNDKQFIADARGAKPDPNAQQITLTVDLKGAPIIPGPANQVRIVAWNAEHYVHSPGEVVDYSPSSGTFAKGGAGGISVEPPQLAEGNYQGDLYTIVAGISNYSNQKLNLNFSSKDAESMAKALQLAGDRLFGCGHVHIVLLSSGGQAPAAVPCAIGSSTAADEVSWASPNKANIQQAFFTAGKAKPQDVLVVFLSGHGVAIGDKYAYPTEDANTIDPNDLSNDTQLLAQTAITSDELANWVNRTSISAEHEVVILDTCAAGEAAVQFAQARDVRGDQIRALDTLKDNTGLHLLMGSAADASSYEASPYEHGLLTYALLEGMKGAALINDNDVDTDSLFSYAIRTVPELARDIGKAQQPTPFAPVGARSFDIGELLPEDRTQIFLAAPMPTVLKPELLNQALGTDNLQLEPLVSSELRNQTNIGYRGDAAPASAFYDDKTGVSGAIAPSGTYTVTGLQVSLTLRLSRDGKLLSSKVVQGQVNNLPALATTVAAAILDGVKALPPAASSSAAKSSPSLQ